MREGWREVHLSEIADRVTTKNAELLDEVFTVSAEHGLVDQEAFFNKRVASKNLTGYTVVEPGQYVYSKSYSKAAPLGAIVRNLHDFPGVVSPLYIVFDVTSDELIDGFLDLAVLSTSFADSLRGHLKEGGRAHGGVNITPKDFFSASILLPPLAEQRRIVDLIGAVDEYITGVEAELEAELSARAAALAEELGRGGDDWVETTLGDVADYINGFPFKPSDLGTEGLPVIRIKQLLDPTETPDYSTVEVPERNLLGDGDLVFSWSGTLAVRRWDRGVAVLNQHLFRVVEKAGVDSGWLQFALDHAIDELLLKTHGTTMKHITKGSLLPHRVVLPPFPEQRRIAELIGAFDEANDALRGEIAAARASRAALLTELLSGDYEIPNSYDDLMENES